MKARNEAGIDFFSKEIPSRINGINVISDLRDTVFERTLHDRLKLSAHLGLMAFQHSSVVYAAKTDLDKPRLALFGYRSGGAISLSHTTVLCTAKRA